MTYICFKSDALALSLGRTTFNNPPINLIDVRMIAATSYSHRARQTELSHTRRLMAEEFAEIDTRSEILQIVSKVSHHSDGDGLRQGSMAAKQGRASAAGFCNYKAASTIHNRMRTCLEQSCRRAKSLILSWLMSVPPPSWPSFKIYATVSTI
jgi:hypothetical protein